jgi:glycosyltransferase involved in cell wall biosynthesis
MKAGGTDPPYLVVDVQGIQNPHHPERGIARYVRELSTALELHGGDVIDCFVANPRLGLVDGLEPLIGSGRLSWNDQAGPPDRGLGHRPFVYWATSIFELGMSLDDVWPRYVRRPEVLTAVTVFDLIPLIYQDHYLRDASVRSRYKARLGLIEGADLVLTISEATADDVVRLLEVSPEKVVNIGTGVSDLWRPAQREYPMSVVQHGFPEIRPDYIFFTGGIDFRKNMERLLEAYARLDRLLRRRHQLVITCSMDPAGEAALRSVIENLGIEDDVVLTGYVPDETLLALYQACRLFVFPSLYEGFGLPLVEAIRAGAPALTADRSSMREIVHRPEFRFDPTDVGEMAESIHRGLSDEDFIRRARTQQFEAVKRFTWDNVAKKALEAIEHVWEIRPTIAGHSNGSASWRWLDSGRPRLAWFSPMPPQATGIADYSGRLVQAISQHADVDVFVDGHPKDYDVPTSESITLRPSEAFRLLDAAGAYDEVVYCMGNSEFHSHVFEALMKRPGAVLAHEVRFHGFYGWYGAHRVHDPTFFHRSMKSQHPGVPDHLGHGGWVTTDEAERFGVYMVSELVQRSSRFLVHSEYAAEVARLQAGPFADRISVVPFGIPDPVPVDRRNTPQQPLVVTVGIAAPIKRTDIFVQSIPAVLGSISDARFAIVGRFVPPEYQKEIEDLVSVLGISNRLTITGQLRQEDYEKWLREATCAIQLRASSNGENSAAVADCLRQGLPTIVSEIGSAREYPRGSIYPLRSSATAREVAEATAEVIRSASLRRSLSERGYELVRGSSFDRAAEALLFQLGLLGRVLVPTG